MTLPLQNEVGVPLLLLTSHSPTMSLTLPRTLKFPQLHYNQIFAYISASSTSGDHLKSEGTTGYTHLHVILMFSQAELVIGIIREV